MHTVIIVKSGGSSVEYYDDALSELSGLSDKRICEGAVSALQVLEKTPADVVIVETDVNEMSGKELVEAIHDIDIEAAHFTYVILTGETLTDDVRAAFSDYVDAWVRNADAAMLNSCVQAGLRIASDMNQLAAENKALMTEREGLMKGQLLDSLTGLGNRRFAEQSLRDSIRHIESRGGAVCFIMISIANLQELRKKYDNTIVGEFTVAVARRIQHLVRPMDITTYFATGTFALVLLQPSIKQCTAECYQRIFDGVSLKSFKTSMGYINAPVGMSICASAADTGVPEFETMMNAAEANLAEAIEKHTIIVKHLGVE